MLAVRFTLQRLLTFTLMPIVLWCAPSANAKLVRLTLDKTRILDPAGKPITLRGYNWGHWGAALPQDAADNHSQGANVVRIILRWWGHYERDHVDSFSPTAPHHLDPENLALLDNYVKWVTSQHMWVVLAIDSNCGQNATQIKPEQAYYCDPGKKFGDRGHNFWTDIEMRKQFFDLWTFIAGRYKDQPYIAMYEPLPEPAPPQSSQAEVSEFYRQLMRTIKKVDPNTPFLIGPYPNYRIKQAPGAFIADAEFKNQIVYTGNLFLHKQQEDADGIKKLNQRINALLEIRDQHQVPIFVQQAGAQTGSDPQMIYTKAIFSLLNKNSVPWTMWEYRDSYSPKNFGVYYRQRAPEGWVLKKDLLGTLKIFFAQ